MQIYMCNTLELGVRTILGVIIGDPLTGLQDQRIFAWYVISNKKQGDEGFVAISY